MTPIEKLFNLDKNMSLLPIERLVIEAILRELKPTQSIEIGSENGGTSNVIACHSKKLTCFDIDPNVGKNLEKIPNIDFLCGRSDEKLVEFISESEKRNIKVDFAFVDGDHSYEGVLNDLQLILSSNVFENCVILIHDCIMHGSKKAFLEAVSKSKISIKTSNINFTQGVINKNSQQRSAGLGLILTGDNEELPVLQSNQNHLYFSDYIDTINPEKIGIITKIWRRLISKKLRDKIWIMRNGINSLDQHQNENDK